MHRVEPQVFIVGETKVNDEGIAAFLDHYGAPNWSSDAGTDLEMMPEIMGRLCYKSFAPGMNANVTKIRERNADYLSNIIRVGHGSVLEHSSINFIFTDVSRVFTHELCRHRVGVAISQESLRFVRLDDLGQWLPTCIAEDEHAIEIFSREFAHAEEVQKELASHFRLDDEATPFERKKVVTSALRRIAPDGLSTTIGWTANVRTLRWLIELRTAPGAEEEIRLVFGKVARILIDRYPALFGDFYVSEESGGLPAFKGEHSKI